MRVRVRVRVCERVKVADDDNNDIDGMYIRVHS